MKIQKKIRKSILKLIEDGNPPGFIKKNAKLLVSTLKICLFCRSEFTTNKKSKKYCSQSCATKARGGWKIASNKLTKEDWSRINKRSYENGHNYVAGGTTKWFDYKNIRVQGTYELRTCYILDKWKEENKIKNWEYTNDRIEYIGNDNKKHSYLLDFKVFENNEMFYYLETKGYIHDNDELKWKATREKGYKLVVWFDEDITKNEK